MQKPSLGRVVIVKVDPSINNGSDEAPAMITRVWSDTMVNLRVLLDGADGVHGIPPTPARTSVTLLESKPDASDTRSHIAWWPPRV